MTSGFDAESFLASFMAAWNDRRIADLVSHYTDDTVMEDPTPTEPIHGRKDIQRYYDEMFAEYPDTEHGVLRAAANGDNLIFEWWFRGTSRATRKA
jgi:ketosteroid isomerase-like protein